MTKHVIHCIFAVCVSMGLLLLMIGMADSVPNAGGQPHAEHPGMVIGADGAARLAHIGSLAFMFNSLLLTLLLAYRQASLPGRKFPQVWGAHGLC